MNKAVYTTAPVAGSWAGAVMSWAGRNNMGRGINNHRILIPELFYLQTDQKRRKN